MEWIDFDSKIVQSSTSVKDKLDIQITQNERKAFSNVGKRCIVIHDIYPLSASSLSCHPVLAMICFMGILKIRIQCLNVSDCIARHRKKSGWSFLPFFIFHTAKVALARVLYKFN
ncbi:MAG: hypothetical protein LBG28_08900 [Tannerella sp.]|nr:hypothetical protein [Tannerella sp.]